MSDLPATFRQIRSLVTPERTLELSLATVDVPEPAAGEVLATLPGTHWDRERGLTEHHYIVPGGGGLGEVINNSFV